MKLKSLISESVLYPYGCIMIYYAVPEWIDILKMINKKDLVITKDIKGLEKDCHLTLLYGIHSNEVSDKKIVNIISKFTIPEIELQDINIFQNEKFDVVKFEIQNRQLEILNSKLKENLPYTSDFPKFQAHVTIAYVKPGTGKKYIGKLKKPLKIKANELVYPKPSGEKIILKLSNGKVQL